MLSADIPPGLWRSVRLCGAEVHGVGHVTRTQAPAQSGSRYGRAGNSPPTASSSRAGRMLRLLVFGNLSLPVTVHLVLSYKCFRAYMLCNKKRSDKTRNPSRADGHQLCAIDIHLPRLQPVITHCTVETSNPQSLNCGPVIDEISRITLIRPQGPH